MSRYTLSLIPVVDAEQRVLGVIRAEEMMNVAAEEATEDMLRIASAPGDRVFGPVGLSVMHRLPWLIVNLGTVLLAVVVISVFETAISAAAVLAVFLPVVAGQGGIAGTQTVTLVVRGLAIGEVPMNAGLRLLGRELALGLVHGIVLGVGRRRHWLRLEGKHRAGDGVGPGNGGKFTGSRASRSRHAVDTEENTRRPGGFVGGIRNHLYRHIRVSDFPGRRRVVHSLDRLTGQRV